jgi:2-polyprenyl-3-methyl-5-hydroxy-6-metoxy-1,4-benzoquinol methylase
MSDWFKKWFSSDEYLSVYSHRNIEDAENLLTLVLDNVSIPENAKVLDAACGAGRHSLILAEKGYAVTAFDLSRNLLKIGQENSESQGLSVNFLCADIRNICLRGAFDLVLNMFTSFGYFESDDENFNFFKNVKKMLKNDCYLVLDYLNSSYLMNNLVSENISRIEGKQILERRNLVDGFVIKDIEIKYNGITRVFKEKVKLYSYKKLIMNFKEMGFNVFKVFGNYNGEPFSELKSERLIIIFTL